MTPDRIQGRDSAILAMLPLVPKMGWRMAALRKAAGPNADLLFPGGPADMVEAYIDMANRRMAAAAEPILAEPRLSRRVRGLILARLAQAEPEKAAVRRAVAVLALPGNAAAGAGCTARTVDAIWRAAGDTSADFSWYTKRAILASVYVPTLLYWLRDSTDPEAAAAFLDRRLAGAARLGRVRPKPKAA